ncbi:MAG: hypothetical protein HY076_07965 [Candidatus Eisenbacteria bacterium]|uniref:Lipoprotein n=1 Tax=Eiseniibacteriota bacterium TaxID=2212470 RepID=A0A9D6L7I8_UNCEI|nr:hypothetical protein [Candidatus Eisenbacteria bacterium]MBI3540191.1 hypothetical protein [Candidatus Eisenbacteria bacterium]
MIRRLAAAAAILIAAGCSSAPAPVPIVGAPADVRLLAGEWGGEYHGDMNGRSGSIVFRLTAAADTAFGDVVMIPARRVNEPSPATPSMGLPMPPAPQVLVIAFVRTARGGVSGELRPYRDPDCDCPVRTRFVGSIHGDTIQGWYVTERTESNGPRQTGSWKVTRNRP